MTPITLFSWGYWGWGNATPELRRMVDAVERERGFAPPLFVDIRYRRGARAEGFRSHTFEDFIGSSRYRWMQSLGNRAIGDKSLERMTIHDPSKAYELLDLAKQCSTEKRRVIFFCACDFPRWNGRRNCHRDLVGTLLLKAAKARGAYVEVVEWPGGSPSDFKMNVTPEVSKGVMQGWENLPIGRELSIARAGSIPFGSRLTLRSSAEELLAITGTARCRNSEWVLPLLDWWVLPLSDHKEVHPKKESATIRRKYGFEPRRSA